jgi:hypothetical protein
LVYALQLEEWTNLASIAASLGTLVLAAFATYQILALRKQVRLTEASLEVSQRSLTEAARSVEVASKSADAAREAVVEATRARVDERAPLVVTWTRKPEWPPFIDRLRSELSPQGLPRILEHRTSAGRVSASNEFIFPEDQDLLLWFLVCGIVRNEGRSSARVMLGGEARFVEDEAKVFEGIAVKPPPVTGEYHFPSQGYVGQRHVLGPGEAAMFEWAAGHPLKDWAAKQKTDIPCESELFVTSHDTTEVGTLDRTRLVLGARPLRPIEGREGHWGLTAIAETGITTYRTIRTYQSLSVKED